ncbi:NAD(P)-dependent dehydrogenase (short-subunit alcohol dehydrogenase family) [Actinocorallia herbida]|uniref:NAD(P)-dependent dehydrogenase (Short-subunit alcohol dehydrogenase family) n=1 Tax=Actinocorallia herbida TaxID=58109 RepID=A0A3N1D3N4_9ACTN|nr:SDR family oxidoreductase [Actinocorallia herbida]ROO88147.1 NAD(P)-dependent dehydrogenase (short-subunit alcohol dehydrogenase family) [Actinocorallia herbida]
MSVTALAPAPVRSPLPDGLAGSTVVVLGGTSGIGLAAGRLLHGVGARVVLVGRDRNRLDSAVAEVSAGDAAGTVLGATADAADEDAVRAVFDLAGRVDHVLLTAGSLTGGGPLETLTAESVRAAFDGRVWAALAAARVAAERLPAGGSITLTSGLFTIRPIPGVSGAAAAIGGVETLAPALAVELAPRRLRVNAVRYGSFDTPLMRTLGGLPTDEAIAAAGSTTPLGRYGTPEEAAAAAILLMSNTYITGQILTIDGAQSLA